MKTVRVRDNVLGSGQVQIFELLTGSVFALLAPPPPSPPSALPPRPAPSSASYTTPNNDDDEKNEEKEEKKKKKKKEEEEEEEEENKEEKEGVRRKGGEGGGGKARKTVLRQSLRRCNRSHAPIRFTRRFTACARPVFMMRMSAPVVECNILDEKCERDHQ
ncbi:hypothetical protein HZH68_013360 [Vespula germanica]|uniref:Uncharacterized protein n=1 Tax=Vespula germanica TaxID=30212 RepID=A0A834JDJ7_VESGE|nr:hypothetical protein HZH68_013360 [Vespula germanica]